MIRNIGWRSIKRGCSNDRHRSKAIYPLLTEKHKKLRETMTKIYQIILRHVHHAKQITDNTHYSHRLTSNDLPDEGVLHTILSTHESSQYVVLAVSEAIQCYLDTEVFSTCEYSQYFLLPSYGHMVESRIKQLRQAFDVFTSIILHLDLSISINLFQIQEWKKLFTAVKNLRSCYCSWMISENDLIQMIQESYIQKYN